MCSKRSEMRDMRSRYWHRLTRKSSSSGFYSLSKDFYLKSEYISMNVLQVILILILLESWRSSQKSPSGASQNTSVLRFSQSQGISRACKGLGLIFVNPQAEVVRMRVGMREKWAAGEGMYYKWLRFRKNLINWECSPSLRNTCDNRKRSSWQWNAKLLLWFLGDVIPSQKEWERGVMNRENRGRGEVVCWNEFFKGGGKETKEFYVSCGQLTVHELVKDEQGAGKCARSAEEKSMWGDENCSPVGKLD